MRFTPFDAPAIMMLAQITKSTTPAMVPAKARLTWVSRTVEMNGAAGVRPCALGNCSARIAKAIPTRACPASFCLLRRPRLRWREILMKSSRKPTSPRPPARKSTSRPLALGSVTVMRCEAR